MARVGAGRSARCDGVRAGRLRAGSLGLCLLLGAAAATAQTASQLTDPAFAPPPQRLTGAVQFSGAPGLAAPPGAERLSIRIAGVEVAGGLPALAPATAALETRLTRGRIAVSEIFDAAADLEAAYANAGYVLARVVLPQQTLVDGGRLRLTVIDGFVEEIDTTGVPGPVRERLTSVTGGLLGRSSLRLQEIERQLLLAGDTYGVALGSALSTGAQPGGTVIVLDPQYRPVTGFVGFDNLLSDGLGNWSLDAGVELNGVLGFGEALYGRVSGSPGSLLSSTPKLRTIAVGGVAPIGTDGLTLNLEATRSETNRSSPAPATASTFDRVSTRLFYPWVRSRAVNLTTQLAFDVQRDRQALVVGGGEIPLFEDRLRVLRLSGDGFWLAESGATTELGAVLSVGLDVGGARRAADAPPELPLSRAGADATFTKLEISARHRQPLGERGLLTVNGRAQTSFGDPLVVSEQLGIATARELSSLAQVPGGLNGDSGWVLRGELAYRYGPEHTGWPVTASPYVFAAAGGLRLEQPEAGETRTLFAHAYGLGLDVFYSADPSFSNASVRVELGRGKRNDGSSGDTLLSIVANLRF